MLYHDSRSAAYRTPPGAGACDTPVTLALRCGKGVKKAWLRLWWQDAEQLIELAPGEDGLWRAFITLPDIPGVLWYHFIADTPKGRLWYGNASDRLGGVGRQYKGEPPGYQLTVYDPAFATPDWMRRGILYQIMPDRFYPGTDPKDKPVPEAGWMHEDWNEYPALRLGGGDNEANDFFGGDLKGICLKLPYLKDLGVTALYLNPIFRARSNHKYDTGDYMQVDPSFGTLKDLKTLCQKARALGIRVILDGVFSHTGADSRYFNLAGRYDEVGAYQSTESPYAGWYTFTRHPDEYECWWGFPTLPTVNKEDESFREFIIGGKDAVCAHYIRCGTSGWRLDVADELPMSFIRQMRARVKGEDPQACLLGEVWEDASNKVSYGEARCYCLGDTLDSVMNYPLREMLIDFMLGKIDAPAVVRRFRHLQENYAPAFFYSLMNLLGSHDKPRIIDVLSGEEGLQPPREQRRARKLSREKYELGRVRYSILWRFLCALPGMPCIYYGDEAGQTGMADPFCRGTYPWGDRDMDLLEQIRDSCRERLKDPVLMTGEARLYASGDGVLAVVRRIRNGKDALGDPAPDGLRVCLINRDEKTATARLRKDDLMPRSFVVDVPGLECSVYSPFPPA